MQCFLVVIAIYFLMEIFLYEKRRNIQQAIKYKAKGKEVNTAYKNLLNKNS